MRCFFLYQYCESPVYTTWEACQGEKVKVAFQCRQPAGSYGIGHETIGARGARIDPLFSNDEVEWYTKRIGSPVLYGVLIKLQPLVLSKSEAADSDDLYGYVSEPEVASDSSADS